MAPQTRTLAVQMAHQDGTPFEGRVSVRLISASRTDEEIVGPLVWQQASFENGSVELELVPCTELGEGACYRAEVWAQKEDAGSRSSAKVFSTAFVMPDRDCALHEIAAVEPVRPSALDAMQSILSAAEQTAASVRQDVSGKLDSSDTLTDAEIDSIF